MVEETVIWIVLCAVEYKHVIDRVRRRRWRWRWRWRWRRCRCRRGIRRWRWRGYWRRRRCGYWRGRGCGYRRGRGRRSRTWRGARRAEIRLEHVDILVDVIDNDKEVVGSIILEAAECAVGRFCRRYDSVSRSGLMGRPLPGMRIECIKGRTAIPGDKLIYRGIPDEAG